MIDIDIRKRFSDTVSVSAALQSDARILALFGRSGAGKSTVINAIAGLTTPDQGRIVIDGHTLFDSERGIKVSVEQRGMGYVFQDGLLFSHMSVRQNLLYGARRNAARFDDRERSEAPVIAFEQVVNVLGIETLLERKTTTLSGGEKQRVAMGRALLSRPRLLLMDEPLASIDAGRRAEILRLIERVRDEFRVRIVYVSHSIAEVSRLADDVALMNEGDVIACGATESIFNRADLRPHTGRYEGGTLVEATATAHNTQYFLTTFSFGNVNLIAPGIDVPIGTRVRIRIRARDVALATQRPHGISIRNVLAGKVAAIDDRHGAIVEIRVDIGECELIARISRQAMDEMGVHLGQSIFALVKAIAFDKRSMGFTA
jgi:molybdate transport system ATP-binding protein